MSSDRLTPKQETFCLRYLESGNASEAYRQVYGTAKTQPETANRNGFKLLQNAKIIARIDFLRAEAAKIATVTVSGVLKDLLEIKRYAMQINSEGLMLRPTEAIKTLELLGKHLGMFTDKIESTNLTQMTIIGGLPDPFADAIDVVDPEPKALTEKETQHADDKAPDAS